MKPPTIFQKVAISAKCVVIAVAAAWVWSYVRVNPKNETRALIPGVLAIIFAVAAVGVWFTKTAPRESE
jgi:hypothetical protein